MARAGMALAVRVLASRVLSRGVECADESKTALMFETRIKYIEELDHLLLKDGGDNRTRHDGE